MAERPLSPHLGIYKPQITSVLSILHRITGVCLALGSLLIVWWLWAAAYSPKCFAALHDAMLSAPGMVVMVGWSAALYYHLCNGIRHLGWDAGYGFEIDAATRSGRLVVLGTALLTALTWLNILG